MTTNDSAPSLAEDPAEDAIPIVLVPSADVDAVLERLDAPSAAWARQGGFTGRLGQVAQLPDGNGALAQVLFGWGDDAARRRDRFHLGDLSRALPKGTYRLDADLDIDEAEEAALGWLLGRYRFQKYKAAAGDGMTDLIAPDGVDAAHLIRVVEGVFIARDLINTPANDLGPVSLAEKAQKLAERHGAQANVIIGADLLAQNFPLIHTVGQAAAEAPRLIDITWGDPAHPKVTLVGKGVCFDTGGLNIKPTGSMALMKKDMGGAATVLGLAHMVMAAKLPVRLRVLIPAVENSISGPAMRPGDVLRSRHGHTVEVNNTDAEGRLVLADALALAAEDKPDLILDMATLTGAARVALGPEVVPFYTDDDDLAVDLARSAARVADPLWRMPLWPGYEREIEPDIADLDNAPKGGFAGSITAALFLKRFVGTARWAHFDIYGWTPAARPGRPKGGECQAARAVLDVLERRYGSGP